MKTLALISCLILGIFISDEVPTSQIVNFTLPKNAKQIDDREINSYGRNLVYGDIIKLSKYKYKINNVFLSFGDQSLGQNMTFSDLERRVYSEPEEMISKGVKVTYETYNQCKFIMVRVSKKNNSYINFISEIKNKISFQGNLTYNNKDKDDAERALKEFLTSIKFK
jgi:hypothetical protein